LQSILSFGISFVCSHSFLLLELIYLPLSTKLYDTSVHEFYCTEHKIKCDVIYIVPTMIPIEWIYLTCTTLSYILNLHFIHTNVLNLLFMISTGIFV